ncbi:CGNR zinc finger domain-containing protein [Protaetiibacter intestinalis]|uniref:CGNR zinc finger domain-containing protein n=1 Tax=Protaetiibacter intestinalis TaxID=2419774 RepID=A0A387B742_9MICO|nr:CGNR zinc finger domain-containing protein [Protaetiibacter intestinalis]AYF97591.1 CGNR zinc finger domain-containing protein [Protaetiibacter intestinalis]
MFDAGALSLDFAYAGELDAWVARRYPAVDAASITDGERRDAQLLREAILRLAAASVDDSPAAADDVDTLNLFAASPDVPPALAGGRRQAGASRIRTTQALSSVARDAVGVLDPDARARLKRCAADDCRRVFHDESRTGTRRWCSMQTCGNRAKVRAHRERARTA